MFVGTVLYCTVRIVRHCWILAGNIPTRVKKRLFSTEKNHEPDIEIQIQIQMQMQMQMQIWNVFGIHHNNMMGLSLNSFDFDDVPGSTKDDDDT